MNIKTIDDVLQSLLFQVDGTMNFVHSFPHSAISVALLVDKVIESRYSDNSIRLNIYLNQGRRNWNRLQSST